MEPQYLRDILGKPEHPRQITFKDLMQFLYHAIRVLIKRRKKLSNL